MLTISNLIMTNLLSKISKRLKNTRKKFKIMKINKKDKSWLTKLLIWVNLKQKSKPKIHLKILNLVKLLNNKFGSLMISFFLVES